MSKTVIFAPPSPHTFTVLTFTVALQTMTQLYQPVGFVVSLVVIFIGFFLPLSMHRIPHPAGWPNPQMVGALIAGVILTTFIYLRRVFYNILLFLLVCFLSSCFIYVCVCVHTLDSSYWCGQTTISRLFSW